jgi:hypothetical protein
MKLETISTQLKEKLQSHSGNTLAMCPWETADFLLKCGEALVKYIECTNKQLEPDSEAFLSKIEIGKIDSLFRELGDNFFPMAHTTEPLRSLKIVNAYEYENLNNRVEDFLLNIANNYEMNLETSNEMNERIIRVNRESIAELRNLREEISIVLNP